MNISSTIRRPLEVTHVDNSVRTALQDSTPAKPAFFVKTPNGYANLSLGADAYQSEELRQIMQPLGTLTATLISDLFPPSEGALDGVGYAMGIHGGVKDFEKEMNFENGLKVLAPIVKIASKAGNGIFPDWANQSISALDGGLTLIAAFKKANSPKETTIKTAFMDGFSETPIKKYIGPLWTLGEFFTNGLETRALLPEGPAINMESLQKRLEEQPEHPWVASLRKEAESREKSCPGIPG